ncbi:MAG: LysR family transcriptional regulator [Myxococcales bacterium]|nr:LysR family transcriptional regulator [Myxococcales bacterium]
MPADPTNLLRFLEVVEAGSFSAAARKLEISRQAVQRSIDALERDAGATLFERTTRRLRLTDLGRRLVPPARALREAGHEVDALLSAATSHPRGRLRISGPPLFADAVLSRVIPAFLARWPEVEVDAQFESGRTDPLRADLDLTIRIGAAPPEQGYAARVGEAPMILCAAPRYLETRGAPERPHLLAAHDLLAYGTGPREWSFDGPQGPVAVPAAARLTSNSAPVIVAACVAGLGIARIPAMAVDAARERGEVIEVLPAWRLPAAQVWALYGHRTATDPTLLAFLDALRGSLPLAMTERRGLSG